MPLNFRMADVGVRPCFIWKSAVVLLFSVLVDLGFSIWEILRWIALGVVSFILSRLMNTKGF